MFLNVEAIAKDVVRSLLQNIYPAELERDALALISWRIKQNKIKNLNTTESSLWFPVDTVWECVWVVLLVSVCVCEYVTVWV